MNEESLEHCTFVLEFEGVGMYVSIENGHIFYASGETKKFLKLKDDFQNTLTIEFKKREASLKIYGNTSTPLIMNLDDFSISRIRSSTSNFFALFLDQSESYIYISESNITSTPSTAPHTSQVYSPTLAPISEEPVTTSKFAPLTKFERVTTTAKPYNVADEEVGELKNLMENEIEMNFATDESEIENDIKIWKPNFEGSSVPIKSVEKKQDEFINHRTPENILGYMDFNGFIDIGMTETHNKNKNTDIKPELDEEAMVESIKAFQRFNGFPETGYMTGNQMSTLSVEGCGNRDTSYKERLQTFSCLEGNVLESDAKTCDKDVEALLDICALYPSLLDHKDFVQKTNYYFEADIEFKNKAKSKKNSHIGIAFNYMRKQRQADYLMVQHEAELKRLCFSFGMFDNGQRKELGYIEQCEKYEDDPETVLFGLFKVRVTVRSNQASFALNGRRRFQFETVKPIKSSVFVFTLAGKNYKTHDVKIPTSRICKKKSSYDNNNKDEQKRAKRYVVSNSKWYPEEDSSITYSFANYSSSFGELYSLQVCEHWLTLASYIINDLNKCSLPWQVLLPETLQFAKLILLLNKYTLNSSPVSLITTISLSTNYNTHIGK